jgi:hypothetical protein
MVASRELQKSSLIAGSVFFALIKESFLTATFGLICLGSLLAERLDVSTSSAVCRLLRSGTNSGTPCGSIPIFAPRNA